MGSNPHANGGLLLRDLALPDFRDYAVPVQRPAPAISEPTRVLGGLLRDVMRLNAARRNFRVFGPDETASNRLGRALRGHRQDLGGSHAAGGREPGPGRPGDGDPVRAPPARAGWRDTC